MLDPRFKCGPGFSEQDKTWIWNQVKIMMREAAMAEVNEARGEHIARQHETHQQHRNGAVDAMFEEINQMAMRDRELIADENEPNNNGNHENEDIFNRVDAELLLYKREQHLPPKKGDGSFNNPLEWWRIKQQQFPLMAQIALRVLPIPATSAPSERVFSVAGITIAAE